MKSIIIIFTILLTILCSAIAYPSSEMTEDSNNEISTASLSSSEKSETSENSESTDEMTKSAASDQSTSENSIDEVSKSIPAESTSNQPSMMMTAEEKISTEVDTVKASNDEKKEELNEEQSVETTTMMIAPAEETKESSDDEKPPSDQSTQIQQQEDEPKTQPSVENESAQEMATTMPANEPVKMTTNEMIAESAITTTKHVMEEATTTEKVMKITAKPLIATQAPKKNYGNSLKISVIMMITIPLIISFV